MSSFDFMWFGYDGDEMFVAHAKKYSAAETVELCMQEFEYLFQDHKIAYEWEAKGMRRPTVADVHGAHCAFRFGVSSEFPNGCYTIVEDGERGSFPVWVIDFSELM